MDERIEIIYGHGENEVLTLRNGWDGLSVRVKRIDKELPMPVSGTEESVGMDLYVRKNVLVQGKDYAFLDLNVIVKPPNGGYVVVVPRSSTFKKTGLILTNSIGIIDPDYCGEEDEIRACVYNVDDKPVQISRGDRLFQMVILPRVIAPVTEIEEVGKKSRGGYGSTD